jgi:hypothetical protein
MWPYALSFLEWPFSFDTGGDRAVLEAADPLPGADFEDNVHIAAAAQAAVDAIITRDPAGFAASPVAVLSPADLAARVS